LETVLAVHCERLDVLHVIESSVESHSDRQRLGALLYLIVDVFELLYKVFVEFDRLQVQVKLDKHSGFFVRRLESYKHGREQTAHLFVGQFTSLIIQVKRQGQLFMVRG